LLQAYKETKIDIKLMLLNKHLIAIS